MIVQKSFLIDEIIHERLKNLAQEKQVPIGAMIRRLLDTYQGRLPNPAAPEFKRWLSAVVKAGRLYGDDGAEHYMVNNPPPV